MSSMKEKNRSEGIGIVETKKTLTESSSSDTLATYAVEEEHSACNSIEDFSEDASGDNLEQSISHGEEEDFFVSLDQNEFLIECFMSNEYSDITFIVHFYAEDSALSYDVEEIILIRSMEAGSNCQCRRINSRLAPLFTTKLGIDPEQPTIVAIRNGAVVDRISDISPGCWELEQWLSDNGILKQKSDNNAFPNTNVHSC